MKILAIPAARAERTKLCARRRDRHGEASNERRSAGQYWIVSDFPL